MPTLKPSHGGARAGAGRKPKPPMLNASLALRTADPRAWLAALMADETVDVRLRVDAAKTLLRAGADVGKKAAADAAAKKTVAGRFVPSAPPLKLV